MANSPQLAESSIRLTPNGKGLTPWAGWGFRQGALQRAKSEFKRHIHVRLAWS